MTSKKNPLIRILHKLKFALQKLTLNNENSLILGIEYIFDGSGEDGQL